jgi:hypothetical protein
MKEFLIQLGSVFDFDVSHGAGRLPEEWMSPYPASVYKAAQSGTAEHPLCKVIAEKLQACEITHKTMVISNAPTGAAVNIGAYLAGEPDCMLSFDAVAIKTSPVNFDLCLNLGAQIDPKEAAKGIANCFAALQSLAITRPVTVTPYAQNFSQNKKETVKITLSSITLTDTIDLAKLALIADSRTLRQFFLNAYYADTRFKNCSRMLVDRTKRDAAIIVVDNGQPTTYEQATAKIAQLIQLQGD